jgi:plasmid stabilization system protein ParE
MSDSDSYRIIISPHASEQLEKIFDYIAEEAPANAAAFIARMLDAVDGLKVFPLRQIAQGQTPGRDPVRSLPFENYMIFYPVSPKRRVVRIVRVAHGARRRPKRFR